MAVTITFDSRQLSNKTLTAAQANGKKGVAGTINFSGLSASIGGVTMTIAGLTTVGACWMEQKSGYQVYYEAASNLIHIPQLVDGFDLGSWTAVKFWAWGN